MITQLDQHHHFGLSGYFGLVLGHCDAVETSAQKAKSGGAGTVVASSATLLVAQSQPRRLK
jgi:hypothetical protein